MQPTPELIERLKGRAMMAQEHFDVQITHSRIAGSKGCTHYRGMMIYGADESGVTIASFGRTLLEWPNIREVQLIPLDHHFPENAAPALEVYA